MAENVTYAAINVIIQSKEPFNIMNDLLIPSMPVLLGVLVGGLLSYFLSIKFYKMGIKNKLTKDAILLINSIIICIEKNKIHLGGYTNLEVISLEEEFSNKYEKFVDFFSDKSNYYFLNKNPSAKEIPNLIGRIKSLSPKSIDNIMPPQSETDRITKYQHKIQNNINKAVNELNYLKEDIYHHKDRNIRLKFAYIIHSIKEFFIKNRQGNS